MSDEPQDLGGRARVEHALHNIETYLGYVPGFRRGHGRGVAFRGRFTPSADASALTSAEHMNSGPVPTVVRLSNMAATPYAADRSSIRRGTVLGLAVRFELPSGGHAEWAAINIPVFTARTPDEFAGMLSAQRPARPFRLPNPLRILAFLARHPQAVAGLKAIVSVKPAKSFATSRFNGLHAYYLVDSHGARRAFRYGWVPLAAPAAISPQEDRVLPPQYLLSEIKLRVAREPVAWDLVFQMAEPGDPVDDSTEQWPPDRRQVTAGRLVIDRLHEDQELVDRSTFDPTRVPAGIELSGDPVLHFRSEIYAESHRRRTSETKPEIKPE